MEVVAAADAHTVACDLRHHASEVLASAQTS
jgi:hypothetical protein